MRVLYVSKAMATRVYRDKLRELAARVELSAIVPERWGARAADPPAGEPWLELAPARAHGHNHFHIYHRAGSWFHRLGPDLVHVDEEPYSAVTGQLARACRSHRVPFVFFAWQNLEKEIPRPFRAVRDFVFRHAGGGIAGSDAAGRVLRAWGFRGPLDVIPQMGVDPERFRPDPEAREAVRDSLGAAAEAFVIGFGGRLVPEKGVHLLVRAAAAVPGSWLLVLGAGPERAALEAAALGLGIGGRTRFAGEVQATEMASWLSACDALALPSLRKPGWIEQFGRILIEAMACGVPVVGSDSGEIPNVIGDAGLVVPEGDEAALAGALQSLARSPELRARLGTRGRDRVLERFTNRVVVDATVAFYDHVLAQARP